MEKTGEQILGELLTEAQALVLKVAKQRDAWRAAAEEALAHLECPRRYPAQVDEVAGLIARARALEEE